MNRENYECKKIAVNVLWVPVRPQHEQQKDDSSVTKIK